MPETNIEDFIGELGAGVFKDKLSHTLSSTALGTVLHGNGKKKGKVTVEFIFTQIGENEQVIVSHKIAHSTPTARGKKAEEDVSETPMFIAKGGVMTIGPPKEDNNGQFSLSQDGKNNSGLSSVK